MGRRSGIIELSLRSARYSAEELSALAFEGPPPNATELSRSWHSAVAMARTIIELLPAAHVGEAVLSTDGGLFVAGPTDLQRALTDGRVRFHRGRIGGAVPQVEPLRRR